MAQDQKVKLIIEAVDAATKELQSVSKSLNDLSRSTKETSTETQGMEFSTASLSTAMIKANLIVKGIETAFNVAGKAISTVSNITQEAAKAFVDLSKRGGQLEGISVGFTDYFGDATVALDDLRKASNNTVADFDLMLSANKAAMLGVTSDSKQLAQLMEIARARGQKMGLDTTQAFSDIVTGIGRSSPLILDNLGIVTKGYQAQIKALEDQGIVLDETTKKQMLLSYVLEGDVAPAVNTAADSVAQWTSWWTNLKDEIAQGVAPIFMQLSDEILPKVQNAVATIRQAIADWWAENKDVIMPKILELKAALVGEDGNGGLYGAFMNLITPGGEFNDALGDAATTLAGGLVDNVITFVDNVTKWLDYLNSHPEEVQKFGEDLSSAANALMSVVGGISWLVSNLGAIANVATQIARIAAAISTGGISELFVAGLKKQQSLYESGAAGPTYGSASSPGSFQFGGRAGGLSLVGERGPELVSLPTGSQVFSTQQSKMAGGGGISLNIQGDVIVDSEQRMDEWVRKIELALGNRINLESRGI